LGVGFVVFGFCAFAIIIFFWFGMIRIIILFYCVYCVGSFEVEYMTLELYFFIYWLYF